MTICSKLTLLACPAGSVGRKRGAPGSASSDAVPNLLPDPLSLEAETAEAEVRAGISIGSLNSTGSGQACRDQGVLIWQMLML